MSRKILWVAAASIEERPVWIPTGIPTAWWDTSDATAMVLDGSKISQLIDKSGNNYNAVMTGVSSPDLSGGFAAFDGVDDFMDINIPQASPSHIFAVVETSALQVGYRVFLERSTVSAPYPPALYLGSNPGNYKPAIYWGNSVVIVGADEHRNTRMQEFRIGDSTVGLRINGGSEQTAAHSLSALSTWVRLNTWNAYDQQGTFSVGEIIIVNAALSDVNRQKIEGYLAHKWGLSDNLPSSHPYKSKPPYAE